MTTERRRNLALILGDEPVADPRVSYGDEPAARAWELAASAAMRDACNPATSEADRRDLLEVHGHFCTLAERLREADLPTRRVKRLEARVCALQHLADDQQAISVAMREADLGGLDDPVELARWAEEVALAEIVLVLIHDRLDRAGTQLGLARRPAAA